MEFAASDLARPLVDRGARLRAHLDEKAGRPALAAGGLTTNGAAAGPVE